MWRKVTYCNLLSRKDRNVTQSNNALSESCIFVLALNGIGIFINTLFESTPLKCKRSLNKKPYLIIAILL